MRELDRKAKAMVVTSSRQSAVKYANEFTAYINRNNYKGIQALVAFSGKVNLDNQKYTEVAINKVAGENLPDAFDTDNYQALLVANKYQTGFDQPTYLVKKIEIGGGGNDFDIADKITASNFQQRKTGEKTHEIESKPNVDLPKPNEVYFDGAVKKKLSEIIEEINAAYNKNFDVDIAAKSALQICDILLKNGHLKDSAKNISLSDFKFAYFDAVQVALLRRVPLFTRPRDFYDVYILFQTQQYNAVSF